MNAVNDRSRDIGEFIPAADDDRIIAVVKRLQKERSGARFMTACLR